MINEWHWIVVSLWLTGKTVLRIEGKAPPECRVSSSELKSLDVRHGFKTPGYKVQI